MAAQASCRNPFAHFAAATNRGSLMLSFEAEEPEYFQEGVLSLD